MNTKEKYDYYKALYPKNIVFIEHYSLYTYDNDSLIIKYIFKDKYLYNSNNYKCTFNALEKLLGLGLGITIIGNKELYDENVKDKSIPFKEVINISPLNEEVYDIYVHLAKLDIREFDVNKVPYYPLRDLRIDGGIR